MTSSSGPPVRVKSALYLPGYSNEFHPTPYGGGSGDQGGGGGGGGQGLLHVFSDISI